MIISNQSKNLLTFVKVDIIFNKDKVNIKCPISNRVKDISSQVRIFYFPKKFNRLNFWAMEA
jgi:hypothetical protein